MPEAAYESFTNDLSLQKPIAEAIETEEGDNISINIVPN